MIVPVFFPGRFPDLFLSVNNPDSVSKPFPFAPPATGGAGTAAGFAPFPPRALSREAAAAEAVAAA